MADDNTFVVGAPLPRVAFVQPQDGLRVVVTWASDGPGPSVQVVDLAPAVFRYRLYAPLRDNPALFGTVHVVDDGFAVAWGDGDDLDMASTTLAELAEQAMTPSDFAAFIKRNGYTLNSVAAELGISRRLAAYYAKDREIPRTVALACRHLDGERQSAVRVDPEAFRVWATRAMAVSASHGVRLPRMRPDLATQYDRLSAAAREDSEGSQGGRLPSSVSAAEIIQED